MKTSLVLLSGLLAAAAALPYEPVCQPGEVKQIECNTCKCVNGQFACTRQACLPQSPHEPVCQPGEVKQIECNTCRCVNGQFACTRQACLPQSPHEPVCQPGEVKQIECNTCRCVGGQFACTRKGCLPRPRAEPVCQPGEVKQVDCNTCRCVNGQFSCTRRGCDQPGPTPHSCQHGLAFIDQCENQCQCRPRGGYACTRKACYGDAQPEEPMTCEVDGEIRIEGRTRYFCDHGIVRFEETDHPDKCTPGASWQHQCNTCTCSPTGIAACTLKACEPLEHPILSGGGSAKTYCDGACPADCGEQWDESRHCYRCQCGPEPAFGDLVVPHDSHCPAGLRPGPVFLVNKICLGHGCAPGSTWSVNDGCSRCVCTDDGEPACTPCKREPTASTVTCEGGLPSCPQDCGQVFNAEKNCFDCPCGVGQPGDTVVAIDDSCPPGTDFREAGAFTKACAPLDQLPQGDTKVCDSPDHSCPADCGLVRFSPAEGCVYCQCGADLGPGDVEIPIYQECDSPLLPGPTLLATKVCRAPTKEECRPDTVYNVACDICLCQEDGVPACTRRDCSLPKYGDVHVCGSGHRHCPDDCGVAGSDSYCQHCQCGLRLDHGDIVIPIEEDCPPGFILKEAGFTTKTCKPGAGCQYGSGFLDECGNVCKCVEGVYGCTKKACLPGQTAEKPKSCDGPSNLPHLPGSRVSCHEGIIRVQSWDEPCILGTAFMDRENCNTCSCTARGEACTLMACLNGSDQDVGNDDSSEEHDVRDGHSATSYHGSDEDVGDGDSSEEHDGRDRHSTTSYHGSDRAVSDDDSSEESDSSESSESSEEDDRH